MCSRRASHTGIASDKSMARVQRTLVSLAGRAVPSRRIIANPAVADMHAVDKTRIEGARCSERYVRTWIKYRAVANGG